jgi:hypothetical protein
VRWLLDLPGQDSAELGDEELVVTAHPRQSFDDQVQEPDLYRLTTGKPLVTGGCWRARCHGLGGHPFHAWARHQASRLRHAIVLITNLEAFLEAAAQPLSRPAAPMRSRRWCWGFAGIVTPEPERDGHL